MYVGHIVVNHQRSRDLIDQILIRSAHVRCLRKNGKTVGQHIGCFYTFGLKVYGSGVGRRVLCNIFVEFGRVLSEYLEVNVTML